MISLSYEKSCLGVHLNIVSDCEISEFYRLKVFFEKVKIFRKYSKLIVGGAPALRVPRSETWLTVYCSLSYQNSRKKKEQGPAHADALDNVKFEIEDVFFTNAPWEFNDKFKL